MASSSEISTSEDGASMAPTFCAFEIGSGVRMPATTSSPCAFGRYSPKKRCSPVDGLRVKATLVVPGVEHRANSAPELVVHVLRKFVIVFDHDIFIRFNELFQTAGGDLRV